MTQATRGKLRSAATVVLPKPVRAAYADVRDAIDQWSVKTGRRNDRALADLLRNELRPGDTCVDLGAGVGLLTIVMANLVGPRGRVLAFESRSENGPKLLANAKWCGLAEQVELHIADDRALMRLDDHVAEKRRIDLIRVDAEAHPEATLDGMARILGRWRPTLLVECQSQAAWDACASLREHGYTLRNGRGHEVDAASSPPLAQVLATHPQRSAA